MTDSIWPVDAVSGDPEYSGRMLRQSFSPMIAGATSSRPLGGRTGVRPGTSTSTVTATSTTWTCGPFAGVADLESASEAGPYSFAFDANATGSVTAAHATLPRKDIIYVQISDPAEADGSSVPSAVRGYLAGTAAASPSAPSAPSRAFTIAEISVPASGGGSPTVLWVAPYTVGAGGIVPLASSSHQTALAPTDGQFGQRTDTGTVLYGSGGSWARMFTPKTTFTPSWTNLIVGSGTNTGWYQIIGNTCSGEVRMTFGAGFALNASGVELGPPVAIASGTGGAPAGQVIYIDAGTGFYTGRLMVSTSGSNNLLVGYDNGSPPTFGNAKAGSPFGLTSGDSILINFSYEI